MGATRLRIETTTMHRLIGLLTFLLLTSGAAPAAAQVFVWEDERGVRHFSDQPRHAGYKRFPIGGGGTPRPRKGASEALQFDGMIALASRSHGVSPALVKAVVHAESRFNERAVSRKGAQGLMQLMPNTAAQLGVDDPFDPWQNIYGGTQYLGGLLQRYEGNVTLALAAYNAGPVAVKRYGGVPPYRETRGYVKKVMNLYQKYDADFR